MLQGALSEQLHRIADAHGGRVPLHGRLFAQWLHYAFPRECPFPHKVGAFNAHTLTPHSFGKEYIASKSEMISHVESAEAAADSTEHDEAWMSQWSEEEELFADYTGQLQAPWETRGFGLKFLALFAIVAVALLWLSGVVEAGKSREAFLDLGMSHRSHMV